MQSCAKATRKHERMHLSYYHRVWSDTSDQHLSLQPQERQLSCSPRRMIFCFLYQRPYSRMLPYTSTSLKRKKTFGCGFRRPCFSSRPWPIRTRPCLHSGLPAAPNEISTARMRSQFSLSNVILFIVAILIPVQRWDREWARCLLQRRYLRHLQLVTQGTFTDKHVTRGNLPALRGSGGLSAQTNAFPLPILSKK